jgi:hypothetical protein
MNKGVACGLGAALMYIFDPDRGKRRRPLIRDKVEAAGNKLSDTADKMQRDLRKRDYGVVAEAKSIFRHDEVTDDVLVDRVRSRLGRIPVHIGAFDISANDYAYWFKVIDPLAEPKLFQDEVCFIVTIRWNDYSYRFAHSFLGRILEQTLGAAIP